MIINKDLPSCINCKYFKEYPNYYPYDESPDKTIHLSTCSKYGKKNVVSGQIQYMLAIEARINSQLCGEKGKYYQGKG